MKKIIALTLCLVLALGCFAGCGAEAADPTKAPDATKAPAEGKDVTLKVWAAQDLQEITKELCEDFAKANPDNKYTFEYGVVGEADAKTKMLEDAEAGADVYTFAQDQINLLADAGALAKIGGANADAIKKDNIDSAIGAATYKDSLYAYPMTADNGYFLYYDKSKVADPSSFTAISKSAADAGAKYVFALDNSWYIPAFFFGAGCELYAQDGKVICDFNSAEGLKAGQAVLEMAKDPSFKAANDDVIKAGFTDGSVVAAVSGTWNAADISAILGDNYGATKLPTAVMGGEETQLGSFAGFKLVGVNPNAKDQAEAHKLAAFLTNEDAQARRFAAKQLGPSNKVVGESAAVKENIALAALAAQAPFATAQPSGIDTYWTPAESFGKDAIAGNITDVQKALDAMVAQIVASESVA